ncbi:MAG: hypothetical protein E4H08_09955, partial [Candidatus Atribacteria bacterium]
MRRSLRAILLWGLLAIAARLVGPQSDGSEWLDMLTSAYYQFGAGDASRVEVDQFLVVCQSVAFHHPLTDTAGQTPQFTVPEIGLFGAQKGPDAEHHAAVDLDLDEVSGLNLNGQIVQAGDLISQHLYAGTAGGPHLHFEIRYLRPEDTGNEEFYGFAGPRADPALTEPSA